jgi:rubrerythrin
MSISMERFEATGQFATYDPFARSGEQARVFSLQCHSCGYEVDNGVIPPRVCPKCRSQAWERSIRPGSLLADAIRH